MIECENDRKEVISSGHKTFICRNLIRNQGALEESAWDE